MELMTMSNILDSTISLIEEVRTFFNSGSFGNKYVSMLDTISSETSSPCVLAIAGKVKSGKSTLLNALLGVDLAITGKTETTATINVFKSGKPLSKDRPILCQWTDGSKEWKPKSFLDQLQGTDESVLSITSKIDRLIFYIEGNPLLDEITIVDTPGIGAIVGDGGDFHEIQTDKYFNLRERYQSETISISNSADAVLYLFNSVPTETDKQFLQGLYDGGKGLSSLNSIGVLAKIDKSPDIKESVPQFAKDFEKELFTILPVSAAVNKMLPDLQTANTIANLLRNGFASERGFETAMLSEVAFFHDSLPDCSLSVEERRCLLSKLGTSDATWEAYKVILTELYTSNNIKESIDRLNLFSGLQDLKNLIYEHFFNRSRLLRCGKILSKLGKILSIFTYSDYYLNSEYNSRIKPQLLLKCKEIDNPYGTILTKIVSDNIPNDNEFAQMKSNLQSFKNQTEELLQKLKEVNDLYMAFQKVISKKDEFTASEFDELSLLFSGKESHQDCIERQRYWSFIQNSSAPNSIRQYVAGVARSRYINLIIANEQD